MASDSEAARAAWTPGCSAPGVTQIDGDDRGEGTAVDAEIGRTDTKKHPHTHTKIPHKTGGTRAIASWFSPRSDRLLTYLLTYFIRIISAQSPIKFEILQ